MGRYVVGGTAQRDRVEGFQRPVSTQENKHPIGSDWTISILYYPHRRTKKKLKILQLFIILVAKWKTGLSIMCGAYQVISSLLSTRRMCSRANKEKSNLIGWRQTLTISPPNHIRFLLVRPKKIAKLKTGFRRSLSRWRQGLASSKLLNIMSL